MESSFEFTGSRLWLSCEGPWNLTYKSAQTPLLWRMKQVGAPVPSPDGRWVVVPVTEPAFEEKDEVSDSWLVPGDGSTPPRRLTTAKGTGGGAAWNPDGTRLAFSAKRDGDESNQIHLLDLAGGEARRLTQVALGVRTPKWSPDGKTILFQSSGYRGATNDADNQRIAGERKKAKSKVRAYDGFPIRRYDKWLDDSQTHLLVIPAAGDSPARDLLAGTALVAGAGFGGASGEGSSDSLQPEWAPDSQSILVTAMTNAHVAAYGEPVLHLFQLELAGGEPRQLTQGKVSHSNATFSPDGRRLGLKLDAGQGVLYALARLAVAPWPWTGELQPVTPKFDRSVVDFAFSPDSSTLYFNGEDSGYLHLWSVPVTGSEPPVALETPRGVWLSPSSPGKSASPALFGLWQTAINPAEVFRVDLATKQSARLTSFAVDQAASVDWQPLREFRFTNRVGRKIHSFLALPPGFDEAKKYPLFVLIHGGHANMWREAISRRWNYHLLARPGYGVLLTDYVGSTGYGEKFTLDFLSDPLRVRPTTSIPLRMKRSGGFRFLTVRGRRPAEPATAGISPTGWRPRPRGTAAWSVTRDWPAFIRSGPPATRSITAS